MSIEHDLEWDCCVDCLMLLANGETPPDLDEEETTAWLAEIERRAAGGHWVIACDENCEGSFSWLQCDVCGSQLGGERHPVVWLEK